MFIARGRPAVVYQSFNLSARADCRKILVVLLLRADSGLLPGFSASPTWSQPWRDTSELGQRVNYRFKIERHL